MVNYMSSAVVTVRVPEELKREMERYKGKINWSAEIREFIAERIEEEKKREAFERLLNLVESLPGVPEGTSKRLVRDDREGH
ncbi:hypothetical protein [Thermococcus sp. M36]|uniref:type II toxin-antitoxin system VapB family antitoxin n=1 Tax=Thermococcus sp. M36 TaxID=1638261 RepID=UPI001F0D0B20|nr:hypothetical protein [Thermococcus sp. M36]